MKKLIFLIVILALAAANAFAARIYPAEGRVVDEQGQAVEYATVVLLKGSDQVAGMATDDTGRFVLKVPSGEYTLSVQYLGFDPVVRQVRVEENNDLGEIVMKSSTTRIEGVVVKAQLIRREADRFVVDVANAPAAIGKDGIELLERAPGVWIDDEKISINGKSGSKVYVNDRELRMEPEQLLTYLRSLRAEEIQKIEVVPTTGADYDADSSGGIIRITLRKRRENGLDGSLSMRTTQNGRHHFYTPSGNINIHTGRLDLYASAWADLGKDTAVSDEHTDYTTGDTNLTSHSEIAERDRNFGGSIGSVFEISPKHSIGAEFEYWRNNEKGPNDSYTDFTDAGVVTRTQSRYDTRNIRNNYSATFNYIYKLDTLGSTLKLLADYTRRETEAGNDNFSRITCPRQEILAPLVAARRRQVHLQRHAQRRALRIREGRRVGAQRQPELHDQLYGEHRGGLRHRLGQPRALEPRGRAEGRIYPHPGQGRRHRSSPSMPARSSARASGASTRSGSRSRTTPTRRETPNSTRLTSRTSA